MLTWAADETHTVIGFDKALDPADWQDLARRVRVESGRFVAAADRFEMIRPGYAVVRAQQTEPRYAVPVKSAVLGEDGRSLVIETAPRTAAVGYAVTVDVPRNEPGIKQAAALDFGHELTGLQAEWETKGGPGWKGWLPHPDPAVVREFTRGSGEHGKALEHLAKPGKLTLRTRLDLSHLLLPATQPGSKLDHTPEPETVTITFRSDAAVGLRAPGCVVKPGGKEVSMTRRLDPADWQDLEVELATPATRLEVSFSTAMDGRQRPLGVRRFLMPFATPAGEMVGKVAIPEIAGGNRENGRRLFHGKAACFTCHQFNGEGHAVGPDLSNTVHRDYANVMRDIVEPGASINPDAVAYQVSLEDGGSVVGTRVGETPEELKIASAGGLVTTVRKSDIRATEALPMSLMPPGLLSALSEQEVKDLMSFLLTSPEKDQ